LTLLLAGLLATVAAAAPVHAGGQGTVVTSTDVLLKVRDDLGDQVNARIASRAERRAADVQRVRVWQDGQVPWVALTLRGRPDAPRVEKWTGAVTLVEDADDFWGLRVDIGRKRSLPLVYQPDGSAIYCGGPVRTRLSNRGQTLTVRVPVGCGWTSPVEIHGYAIVERSGHEWMGEDDIEADAELVWRPDET